MICQEHIECYRISYAPDAYEKAAAKAGSQLVVPIGAVYAIETLCNEIERLWAEIDLVKDACRDE